MTLQFMGSPLERLGPPSRRKQKATWPQRPRRGTPSWPGPSALLCLFLLACALAGCGVKGPPRPPGGTELPPPGSPAASLPRPSAEPTPSAPPSVAPPVEGARTDPDAGVPPAATPPPAR